MDIPKVIEQAGVVGAGGAGFPAHVKASAKAEIVIANGAECEPLLQKDREILKAYPEEVLRGLEMMVRSTGAREGVLAVKAKHGGLVELYSERMKGRPGLRLFPLDDFYPAGDEFSLAFDVTGKRIPPGGIPVQIGVVVNNVETLYNVARSASEPVTETFLTVAGAVNKPCTLRLPIGASFADALAEAGGSKVKDFAALDGGAMMGRVLRDMSEPLAKTSGGFIVLPSGHPLIRHKSAPRHVFSCIGKSACDQCSFCTEFCPRYLLGYGIQPHRVMRSLCFSDSNRRPLNEWALLCCECSLCSLYACPEDLDPKNVCAAAKGDLIKMNIDWKTSSLNSGKPATAHPMRDFRKVPLSRLIRRLGLQDYKADAPLIETRIPIRKVGIPVKQHAGVPSVPTVSVGQKVKKGQLVAETAPKALGANIHASIDGVVRSVGDTIVIEAD